MSDKELMKMYRERMLAWRKRALEAEQRLKALRSAAEVLVTCVQMNDQETSH
jgi:hypothetical protein